MNTLKEATIETIKRLPDGCTAEDIMYEINFVSQILEGLQDAEDGKVISTDKLLAKVDEWQK
jgi:predicted transcriptional regulator